MLLVWQRRLGQRPWRGQRRTACHAAQLCRNAEGRRCSPCARRPGLGSHRQDLCVDVEEHIWVLPEKLVVALDCGVVVLQGEGPARRWGGLGRGEVRVRRRAGARRCHGRRRGTHAPGAAHSQTARGSRCLAPWYRSAPIPGPLRAGGRMGAGLVERTPAETRSCAAGRAGAAGGALCLRAPRAHAPAKPPCTSFVWAPAWAPALQGSPRSGLKPGP